MYQNIATKVLTGEVRLSYVHLTEPYQNKQGGDPRYQVTLLIPKSDTVTKADIDASIKAAYEDGVKNKWKGVRPQMKNALIYDGDGTKTNGTPFGAECKGHWVITASSPSSRKPNVVDVSNIYVELAPTDIYSGMYARATLNFFSYDSHGSKGVGCGLSNIMKTRDGEALSGGASAASDFAGIGQSVVPQTQAATPQPGYNSTAAMTYGAGVAAMGGYVDPLTGAPTNSGFSQPAIDPITGMPRQ